MTAEFDTTGFQAKNEKRNDLRRCGIDARNALTPNEREYLSRLATERIAESEIYKESRVIMLYSAVKGELCLNGLDNADGTADKIIAYPVCTGPGEMEAYILLDKDSWRTGKYGISESDPAKSRQVNPEELDLVICPCAAFDVYRNRLGIGAGYYDRYLKRCVNAKIAVAAFDVQKVDLIPAESWDMPAEYTFTDAAVYRQNISA